MITVRAVSADDEGEWRSMWAAYNAFYKTEIAEPVTAETWRRILDPEEPFGSILALDEQRPIGFANYVLHPFTWSIGRSCLMEDLFVRQDARREGAGAMLIQHLIDLGRREGWAKLYWITHETNQTARRLYDRFSPPDGFIQYTIPLSEDS